MSDEDDSDDDLFAEFENDDGTELNVSANLLADVGQEQKEVHAGEADEGKVFWVAPAVCVAKVALERRPAPPPLSTPHRPSPCARRSPSHFARPSLWCGRRHGLRNSDKVTAKESHWYLDNKFANEPDKNKTPPAKPGPPAPAAMTPLGVNSGNAFPFMGGAATPQPDATPPFASIFGGGGGGFQF